MRSIQKIQEDALELSQCAATVRSRLAGLVSELRQRCDPDGWSAAGV